MKKLLLSALGSAAAVGAYIKYLRPQIINWGAAVDEITQSLPGDEFVGNPTYTTTRAITIEASVDEIWPWLVQIGEGRGGFYSYDFIDRLLGLKVHSAHRVLPRFQELEEGDALIKSGEMVVRHIEPKRAIVVGGAEPKGDIDSTWAIVLEPIGEYRTRLISRVRPRFDLQSPKALAMMVLLEPGQFIMEQKFLREVKKHAEGRFEKWPPEAPITLH